jgi:hypothetical protein
MTPPVDPQRERPRRRRGPIILILVAAGLVVAGAAGVGLWEVSSSPMLCNSCHIMKPYVAAWKTSKHNIWVKYQALTQVVKWATQTYSSKPFAEVEDGSCLRSGCHDRRLLEGKVVFKRGVMFDHKPHLEQSPNTTSSS